MQTSQSEPHLIGYPPLLELTPKPPSTQYGVIGSAGAIVNSVWPLIGGICLDWFGINTITLLCTGGIFIGSIVAALAANTGLWRMMVGGHIMMGFGTSVLDSAQHKIFYHYFGAGGLALAFGIEYATANLFLMCSGFSTIPIKDGTGWYGWSFWIPACLCLLSFLVNIYYVLWESRILPSHMRMPNGRAIAIAKRASGPIGVADETSIHPRVVLAIPWAFWVLPMTQLFQSQAAYGPLSESATDLIMMKGYSESVAAYTANVRNILPIVLTPFIGLAIDRWGHRFHLMAFAPVLWVIACAIIGFTDVHPLLPVIISSLGATITAFPIQVTIPLLLRDQQKIGTAFGVWRCFNNSGGTLMSIIQGIVQDRTPNMAYTNVLLIGIAFKTLDVFIGLGYIAMDYLYLGRGITMGEKQRLALEDQIDDPTSDRLTRRTAYRWVSVAGLCLLGGMVGSAWAVFIKYVL
ncbi:hypothetical protein IAT38_002736 [Cryptococcus sp. DSM 104549]